MHLCESRTSKFYVIIWCHPCVAIQGLDCWLSELLQIKRSKVHQSSDPNLKASASSHTIPSWYFLHKCGTVCGTHVAPRCQIYISHYGRPPLCRVPGAHGKAPKAHGKPFAVCRTRQSAHGNQASAKPAFAVCYISGTRQRVCRVPLSTHGKIKQPARNDDVVKYLPRALQTWHTAKFKSLPCAMVFAHGKGARTNFFCLIITYMVPPENHIYHNDYSMYLNKHHRHLIHTYK